MTGDTVEKKRVLQLTKQKLEPDWMRELRLAALTAYEQLQLQVPLLLTEPKAARKTGLFTAQKTAAPCPDLLEPETFFLKNGRNRISYANERIVVHHIEANLAKAGVLLVDLSLAIRVYPKLVRPYLGQLVTHRDSKWTALQTAVWNAGVFLYVPKNIRIKVPLQAWWHRTKAGGTLHPRVLVVAEPGSDVTLLTGEVSKLEEEAFAVGITEVFAKQNARVRITSLTEHEEHMTRHTYARAHVERDAQVEWLYAEGGRGATVAEVKNMLAGDGSRSKIDVAALGHGKQRLDLILEAHHIARHTESAIREHAIVTDEARSDSRVLSKIDKGAVGTHSLQEARMILLSEKAQAQAVPMLLIDEEDVKCDHAVSVGKLPPEPLFYLMSRGLTEREAKRLLLSGFVTPLADGLGIAGLQELLEVWIERKMAR